MKKSTSIPVSGEPDPKIQGTIQISLSEDVLNMIRVVQESYVQSEMSVPVRRTQICSAALHYGLCHMISRLTAETKN